MTGDYSRSTFKPKAHFNGVLMQQGRVQIDADWNEFVEIVNDRDAARTVDIIGAVGVPRTTGGFDITPILNGDGDLNDLSISPGVIYVEGVRVALGPARVSVQIKPETPTVIEVGNWVVDGLPFAIGQQIAVPVTDAPPQVLLISEVDPSKLTITVADTITNTGAKDIVRTTTYLFQPNYRSQPYLATAYAPTPPALPPPTEGKGILAYLNVWQRVVTALDDPEIADPALNGADTAVRSQIVWQVDYAVVDIPPPVLNQPEDNESPSKDEPNLMAPPADEFACTLMPEQSSAVVEAWQASLAAAAAARGRMSAKHQALSASTLKNQLYRTQIHGSDYVKTPSTQPATVSGYEVTTADALDGYPWLVGQTILLTPSPGSTDVLVQILNVAVNSSTATLTVDCKPGDVDRSATSWTVQRTPTFVWARDNASIAANLASVNGSEIVIDDDGRDTVTGFQGCQWIELTCDSLEGQGAPGIILQVKEVRGTTISTILNYGELGMPLDMSAVWAVRRWDSPYTGLDGKLPPSVQAAVIVLGEGIPIEDGISVDFEQASVYETGDYWWVVSRTNGETIEWPSDAFGPVKKHPVGIDRAYAQLAIVYHESSWHACDVRPQFGQSVDFVDKTGDLMTGPLKIVPEGDVPYGLVTSDPVYLNVGSIAGGEPAPISDPEAGLFVSGDVLAFKHENKNSFVGMLAPRLAADEATIVEAARMVLVGVGGDAAIIPRLDFSSALTMQPLIRFEVINQTVDTPILKLSAPPGPPNSLIPQVTLFVDGNIYASGSITENHGPSNNTSSKSVGELNTMVAEQTRQIAELTRRIEELERSGR